MSEEFIYGYSRALVNIIAAIMRTKEYDHEKVKAIKAILSVANPMELPVDLYDIDEEADE